MESCVQSAFLRARGSMDRATDYGSVGWGFKSLRARQRLQILGFFLCSFPPGSFKANGLAVFFCFHSTGSLNPSFLRREPLGTGKEFSRYYRHHPGRLSCLPFATAQPKIPKTRNVPCEATESLPSTETKILKTKFKSTGSFRKRRGAKACSKAAEDEEQTKKKGKITSYILPFCRASLPSSEIAQIP